MKRGSKIAFFLVLLVSIPAPTSRAEKTGVYIRLSQVGYLPSSIKCAVAFSSQPLRGSFHLIEAAAGQVVFEGQLSLPQAQVWGKFSHYTELDFSSYQKTGRFFLRLTQSGIESAPFSINASAYSRLPDQLLEFMRQQRCGYNPFLDSVCHPFDSRTAFGPMTDGSYLDARGGWHDAGDQLKYLLTASNATAQMLLAYKVAPAVTGRSDRGGLVDGPVTVTIFKSLKGVALSRPDPFADFQSEQAVYHGDMADYSSNEPTMDGTASAILLLALAARQ